MKKILFTILSFFVAASPALAQTWTAPTASAPSSNAPAPVNTSSTAQVKSGGLSVGSFINNGGSYFVGNVGIGTSNPILGKLEVDGTGTGLTGAVIGLNEVGARSWYIGAGKTTSGTLTVGSGSGGDAMTIDGSGHVGIGTTNPTANLQVGAISTTGVSTANPTLIAADSTFGTNAIGKNFKLKTFQQGSSSNYDYGLGVSNNLFELTAGSSGDFAFFSNAATPTELLRIKSTGNVGIGTASPSAKLEVAGSVRLGSNTFAKSTLGTGDIQLDNGGQDTPGIHFYSAANSNFGIDVGTISGNPGLRFVQNLDETGGIVRMDINNSGNVGIGTTSPAFNLDVNGDINYTGTLRQNGVAVSTGGSQWTTSGSNIYYNAGNVGIGTASPVHKLDVNGGDANGWVNMVTADSGTTGLLLGKRGGVASMGTVGATSMSLNPDGGNVGIGTVSPSTKAHVFGTLTVDAAGQSLNSYSEGIRLGAASNGYSIITFGANPAAASGAQANQWWIGKHGGDSGFNIWGNSPGDAFHILPSGNVGIGTITPGYKLSISGTGAVRNEIIGTDVNSTAGLFLRSNGNAGGTTIRDNNKNLEIFTSTAGQVVTVQDATGNVGIGTTTPAAKTDIYDSSSWPASNTGSLSITTTNSVAAGITLNNQSASGRTYSLLSTGGTSGAGGGKFGIFDNPSLSYRMVIDSSGNVGIGTTTPTQKLDVNGSIGITGTNALTFDAYGGGWYMQDGTWLRTLNNASIWTGNGLLGSNYGLTVGYGGTASPSGGAVIAGNVGIGSSAPTAKLLVDSAAGSVPAAGLVRLGSTDYSTQTNNILLSVAPGVVNVDAPGVVGGRFKIDASGNVGVGVTSPAAKLDVAGAGNFSSSVTATAFYYSSDRNLKKNIQPLDSNDALDKITKLQGVTFDWKDAARGTGTNVGLIAQDVEKVYPELVKTDAKTGYKSVEYGNLVAPLIEAVKAQQKEIEALKAEVEALKNK